MPPEGLHLGQGFLLHQVLRAGFWTARVTFSPREIVDSGHIWEPGAKLGGFQVYDVSGFQVYGVKEIRVLGEGEARERCPEAATSLQQRPLPDAYDLTGMENLLNPQNYAVSLSARGM